MLVSKRGFIIVVLFLVLLVLPLVNSEIMLSQPLSTYNLGDILEVKATIKPSQYISDFFEMNLVCNQEKKNFYKTPLTLNKAEEKEISASLTLTKSFLGELLGECNILARFSNENSETQKFKISNKIDVILNMENISLDAGKEIEIKGSSLKENGKKVEGFVEISVDGKDIKITRAVTNGEFVANLKFPENIRAGNYVLIAKVYEKSQGEESNNGEARAIINIKRKPSKIEIAILKQNVNPGEILMYTPIIYDQANEEVGGDVAVKIYDPSDSIFLQNILKSGEEQELSLESNSKPGYWRIEASALDLEAKRLFYVEELEKAGFEIVNDTLIITNIGNVLYKKSVQISIGEVVEIQDINLKVGETKKFRLLAPKGKYNIRVSDGTEELSVENIGLTGQVIGVADIAGKGSFFGRYSVPWFFLIVVLGVFIITLVQKIVKRRFYAQAVAFREEKKSTEKISSQDLKKGLIAPSPEQVERAEHSLVLHGKKENTGIVVVNVRDLQDIKKSSPTIDSISKIIIDNKGAIYETSNNIIGIFSSPTTKTFENDLLAIKSSRRIDEVLKEYNKRSKEKIIYGIATNSGELILKKEPHALKFTSIGNTINLGKRIAALANNEVLLSEDIQKRLGSVIKADKEVKQGINTYHLKSIIDRDKNKDFISNFLTRLKEGDKK